MKETMGEEWDRLEARLRAAEAERDRLREALERIAEPSYTLVDGAIEDRDIARQALEGTSE